MTTYEPSEREESEAPAREERKPVIASVYEWMGTFVSALVCVALIFAFAFRVAGVDGDSMNDTLHDRDYVLLSSWMYTPQRGDIVVINRYHEGDADPSIEPLIKRIIGMPGDTVQITETTVYVNGEALDEPYVHYPNYPADLEVTVPAGHVFVMGDHRNNSLDSRFEAVGFVEISDIVGKAVFRLLPLSQFGSID